MPLLLFNTHFAQTVQTLFWKMTRLTTCTITIFMQQGNEPRERTGEETKRSVKRIRGSILVSACELNATIDRVHT